MTKEAWLANYNEVGDYFGALKKAIDEVRAENAAEETIYIPLEVELPSPYGTFTPDNVNNLPSMLAKEHESDFNELKELLKAVWKNYVERIKAHEPDHDAYYEYRHGAEATKLWKENEAEIYAFLTTFETLLDAEKERRFGGRQSNDEPQNQGVYSISFREVAGKITSSVSKLLKAPDETLPEPIPYEPGERDELRKELFARKEHFTRIIQEETPSSIEESEKQMRRIITAADYSHTKKKVDLEYANLINKETARFFEIFGDPGTVYDVVFVDELGSDVAQFHEEKRRINIRNVSIDELQAIIEKENQRGSWKAKTPGAIIWHELGHAYVAYLKETDPNFYKRIYYADKLAKEYKSKGIWEKSKYGNSNLNEFVAELLAERHDSTDNKEVSYLLRILTEDNFVAVYDEAQNGIVL